MTIILLILKRCGDNNVNTNINEKKFPYQKPCYHFCVKVTTSKFSQPIIMVSDKTSTPKPVRR